MLHIRVGVEPHSEKKSSVSHSFSSDGYGFFINIVSAEGRTLCRPKVFPDDNAGELVADAVAKQRSTRGMPQLEDALLELRGKPVRADRSIHWNGIGAGDELVLRGGRASSSQGGATRSTGASVARGSRSAPSRGRAEAAGRSSARTPTGRREVRASVAKAFDRFDDNGSGFLSVRELRGALAHYGVDVDAAGAREVLRRYDDDPDGRLDLGEFDELVDDLEQGVVRTAGGARAAAAASRRGESTVASRRQVRPPRELGRGSRSQPTGRAERVEVAKEGVDELRRSFGAMGGGGVLDAEVRAVADLLYETVVLEARGLRKKNLSLRQRLDDDDDDESLSDESDESDESERDGRRTRRRGGTRRSWRARFDGSDDDDDGSDDDDVDERWDDRRVGSRVRGGRPRPERRGQRHENGGGGRTVSKPVRDAFAAFDTNDSGYLDHRELRKALRLYGMRLETPDAKRVLRAYDDTPDGKLDVHEFAELVIDIESGKTWHRSQAEAGASARKAPPAAAPAAVVGGKAAGGHRAASKRVADVFGRFDVNRSGFLDYRELRDALEHYGIDVDAEGAREVVARYVRACPDPCWPLTSAPPPPLSLPAHPLSIADRTDRTMREWPRLPSALLTIRPLTPSQDDFPDGKLDVKEFEQLVGDIEHGVLRSSGHRAHSQGELTTAVGQKYTRWSSQRRTTEAAAYRNLERELRDDVMNEALLTEELEEQERQELEREDELTQAIVDELEAEILDEQAAQEALLAEVLETMDYDEYACRRKRSTWRMQSTWHICSLPRGIPSSRACVVQVL